MVARRWSSSGGGRACQKYCARGVLLGVDEAYLIHLADQNIARLMAPESTSRGMCREPRCDMLGVQPAHCPPGTSYWP